MDKLYLQPTHPTAEYAPITVKKALVNIIQSDFTSPASYKEWSGKVKPGQSISKIHPKGFGFSMIKLDNNKPAPTLTKTHTPAVGLLHPVEDRFLSIPEVMRISAFPDSFQFPKQTTVLKTRMKSWGVMGNSVPPLFMEAIARHIKTNYLDKMNT